MLIEGNVPPLLHLFIYLKRDRTSLSLPIRKFGLVWSMLLEEKFCIHQSWMLLILPLLKTMYICIYLLTYRLQDYNNKDTVTTDNILFCLYNVSGKQPYLWNHHQHLSSKCYNSFKEWWNIYRIVFNSCRKSFLSCLPSKVVIIMNFHSHKVMFIGLGYSTEDDDTINNMVLHTALFSEG